MLIVLKNGFKKILYRYNMEFVFIILYKKPKDLKLWSLSKL